MLNLNKLNGMGQKSVVPFLKPAERLKGTQSGGVLVSVLIVVMTMLGMSVLLLYKKLDLEKATHLPRIKMQATYMESKIRAASQDIGSYTCSGATFDTCTINTAVFSSLVDQASRQVCAAGGSSLGKNCRFELTNISLDANRLFKGKLEFKGDVAQFKPIPIEFFVAADLLDVKGAMCDVTKPVYGGFDKKTGAKICLPLPVHCGAGEYIRMVDRSTLKVECKAIADTVPACDDNQFMEQVKWDGYDPKTFEPKFKVVCKDQIKPSTLYDTKKWIETISSVLGPMPTSDPVKPKPADEYYDCYELGSRSVNPSKCGSIDWNGTGISVGDCYENISFTFKRSDSSCPSSDWNCSESGSVTTAGQKNYTVTCSEITSASKCCQSDPDSVPFWDTAGECDCVGGGKFKRQIWHPKKPTAPDVCSKFDCKAMTLTTQENDDNLDKECKAKKACP